MVTTQNKRQRYCARLLFERNDRRNFQKQTSVGTHTFPNAVRKNWRTCGFESSATLFSLPVIQLRYGANTFRRRWMDSALKPTSFYKRKNGFLIAFLFSLRTAGFQFLF